VCEFVTAQAQAEEANGGGWAGYRDVFLSAEVQDLIRLRLQDEEGATAVDVAGDGAPTKQKRKLDVSPPAAALDSVSWTICNMDGATLSVEVACESATFHQIGLEQRKHFCVDPLLFEGESFIKEGTMAERGGSGRGLELFGARFGVALGEPRY
jgi:hypothetical protein